MFTELCGRVSQMPCHSSTANSGRSCRKGVSDYSTATTSGRQRAVPACLNARYVCPQSHFRQMDGQGSNDSIFRTAVAVITQNWLDCYLLRTQNPTWRCCHAPIRFLLQSVWRCFGTSQCAAALNRTTVSSHSVSSFLTKFTRLLTSYRP
jgi:hypothetical protein